jgi:hypothetical protein
MVQDRGHDAGSRLRSPVGSAIVTAGEGDGAMRWLLLLPFVGLLWPPLYNRIEPALFGFPFFYWYQLAWIPGGMIVMWIVWQSERR